jgi:ceramide glucosyltransferase
VLRDALAWLLAGAAVGSLVYCVLVILAARRYLAVRPQSLRVPPEPVSILKPLHGLDDGLEENLRSFFTQDYPGEFELLFAARNAADPCWQVVERLKSEFPAVPVRTFLTGEPAYPNAKVYSLELMQRAARHDLLIMSDSDIRVTPALARTIAAEFQQPGLGVATCPYRAVAGRSFWPTLEAIGMNTEFWASAIVARMVEGGVKFSIGPTVAARRSVIDSLGGWRRLSEYLAEDFVLGQLAAEAGHGVILSSYVIEHRIGAQPWRANFAHRLRWNRSTRRSRPAGYVGQLFTNPLPLALLAVVFQPHWWPLLAATAAMRAAAAWAIAGPTLHDPLCRRRWYLIPVQDALSFVFWCAGFFGNTILWRNRRYRLHKDGRFTLIV